MVVAMNFPRHNAAEMTYALAFATETKGIPLSFENTIKLK